MPNNSWLWSLQELYSILGKGSNIFIFIIWLKFVPYKEYEFFKYQVPAETALEWFFAGFWTGPKLDIEI